jgi:hypothetical protein
MLGLALLAPAPADADVIDNILTLIDPELSEARPLIDCLVAGNSVDACAVAQANAAANDQVAKMMAGDSTILLVVDIVKAATHKPRGDWVRVLELAGVDLLFKIGCQVGVPTGGPIKGFICGPLFRPVLEMAKPVVREVLVAINNKDWLRLVALLGPTTACQIIPGDDPATGAICSVLGKLIDGLADLAGGAAAAAWGQIQDWSEDLQGQSQHMSYDEFYARYLRHLVHKRTLQRLQSNRQGLGLDPPEWNSCVSYFDSHKQAESTANKTCTDLGHRLHRESEVFIGFVESAPQSYFDAYLKPGVRDLVAENFWTDQSEDFQTRIFALPPQKWGMGNFPASANVYFGEYNKCFAGMHNMVNGGNPYPAYPQLAPESVRDWACYHAAGLLYAKALTTEKLRLSITVKSKLSGVGCGVERSGNHNSLVFKCDNFAGYVGCMAEFKDSRYSHCRIDKIAADLSLGKQLTAALGARRCRFAENSKEGYHDPRVVCSREWKQQQCAQLLHQQLKNPVLAKHPFTQSTVKCEYVEQPAYKQAKATAQQILDVLNGDAAPAQSAGSGSDQLTVHDRYRPRLAQDKPATMVAAPSMRERLIAAEALNNCTATWDPLALKCKYPAVLDSLAARMPGVTLPDCAPDPGKHGADSVCYAGIRAIAPPGEGDSVRQPQTPIAPSGGTAGAADADGSTGRRIQPQRIKPPEQPDLQVAGTPKVAGRPVQWEGQLELDATALRLATGSGCAVAIDYQVANHGSAMSPAAAQDRWIVQGRQPDARASVQRIPPGEVRAQQVLLTLYPGENRIILMLDPDSRIAESDESNNSASLRVRLRGNCAARRPPLMKAPVPQPR